MAACDKAALPGIHGAEIQSSGGVFMQVSAAEARWSAATAQLNRQQDSLKQASLIADQLKAAHDRLEEDFAASNATKDQLQASLKVGAPSTFAAEECGKTLSAAAFRLIYITKHKDAPAAPYG